MLWSQYGLHKKFPGVHHYAGPSHPMLQLPNGGKKGVLMSAMARKDMAAGCVM
jgi:hypothetical protein